MITEALEASSQLLSVEGYQHLLDAAIECSPRLHQHLSTIGPIAMPARSADNLPAFLTRVVIRQQLSRPAAQGIQRKLQVAIKRAGVDLSEFLRDKYIEEMRAAGLASQKAKALVAIGEAFRAGMLSEELLAAEATEKRSLRLTKVWGIGQWTADMVAISYFRDADVWPEGDRTVKVTFNTLMNAPIESPTSQRVERFSPYRSALAQYMWRIADDVPRDRDGTARPKQ